MEVFMCDHDGLDWEEIALAGALAEAMIEEERERLKAEREVESKQEDDEV
jgi:hypothetical protein